MKKLQGVVLPSPSGGIASENYARDPTNDLMPGCVMHTINVSGDVL